MLVLACCTCVGSWPCILVPKRDQPWKGQDTDCAACLGCHNACSSRHMIVACLHTASGTTQLMAWPGKRLPASTWLGLHPSPRPHRSPPPHLRLHQRLPARYTARQPAALQPLAAPARCSSSFPCLWLHQGTHAECALHSARDRPNGSII